MRYSGKAAATSMRFALLALLATTSAAQAQTSFDCMPTLTRVLVRNGQDWKEASPKPTEKSIIRELRPEERRASNRTWGMFLNGEASATAVCAKYDTAVTCGVPGNTLDFNTRTGRYVRTYFASFLSRDSSEIFLEAGRCTPHPD
jgi:hypothetical protein